MKFTKADVLLVPNFSWWFWFFFLQLLVLSPVFLDFLTLRIDYRSLYVGTVPGTGWVEQHIFSRLVLINLPAYRPMVGLCSRIFLSWRRPWSLETEVPKQRFAHFRMAIGWIASLLWPGPGTRSLRRQAMAQESKKELYIYIYKSPPLLRGL